MIIFIFHTLNKKDSIYIKETLVLLIYIWELSKMECHINNGFSVTQMSFESIFVFLTRIWGLISLFG